MRDVVYNIYHQLKEQYFLVLINTNMSKIKFFTIIVCFENGKDFKIVLIQ